MRKVTKGVVLGVVLVFFFIGCGKQPVQEINEAKAAIEAAVKEGAEIYGADELKKLNDDYTTAMDMIKAQEGKMFKSFGKAKEMLTQVKVNAETLKAAIPARKEEAKNKALKAQEEAEAALEEAKALVEKAPKGKGTRADIEAFTADLQTLESSFGEIQPTIDGEDYFGAVSKAQTIKEKATAISEEIKRAMEKVKSK